MFCVEPCPWRCSDAWCSRRPPSPAMPRPSRLSVSSAGVQGDGRSFSPSISADGRYVAFYSYATNLVGSDTNGYAHVFVGRAHLPGRSAR